MTDSLRPSVATVYSMPPLRCVVTRERTGRMPSAETVFPATEMRVCLVWESLSGLDFLEGVAHLIWPGRDFSALALAVAAAALSAAAAAVSSSFCCCSRAEMGLKFCAVSTAMRSCSATRRSE